MRKSVAVFLAALCTCAAFSLASCAQSVSSSDAPAEEAKGAEQAGEKPEQVLRAMADYLGTLPAFACQAESNLEVTMQGGEQKMVTKMAVRLQRPNRLAMIVEEGVMGMTLVSDGQQLIQYMPMLNRYVEADAPEDLSGFGAAVGPVGIPLVGNLDSVIPTSPDAFYQAMTEGVSESQYVGQEKIGDVLCHHLRFVQDGFDWEIWIEAGDRPVPHKVVPDLSKQFGEGEGQPQIKWTVQLSDWNVSPEFTEADFAFEPPAGAEKVASMLEGMGREAAPHALLGEPAPPFETVNVEGTPVDLKQHLGKNVIMLDFWATWCGPCIQAMPEVDGVAKKFADKGLVFYGVNVGEDAETIQAFLAESELEVPVAMDAEGTIASQYKVEGIPQTVLIGKDGKVQVVHVGFSGNLAQTLSDQIEDLLAGKDLASEALKESEASQSDKSSSQIQTVDAGVELAWSHSGTYRGVAVDRNASRIYAAKGSTAIVLDSAGKESDEFPLVQPGLLRLANLVDGDAPEIITFQTWSAAPKAQTAAGDSLWEYTRGDGVDDVWAADVNQDNVDEVIVGYNGGTGLHLVDNRGNPLWTFTDIGNVWHVAAGDFNADDQTEVVTTSAQGALHVFDKDGNKIKDIRLSIYGNMVRMATIGGMELAIVTGTGDSGEMLIGVDFEGNEKYSLSLPTAGIDHVDDMAIAPDAHWAAVAMRGGLINVVDLESARVVACATKQGGSPAVAWLPRKEKSPLLLVASETTLNAFEVTPTDVLQSDRGLQEKADR